jgi:hypothetical protein
MPGTDGPGSEKLMAIALIDDLNGKLGAERVEFPLAGRLYEIDLDPENKVGLERLLEALEPFLQAARDITPAAGITHQTTQVDAKTIRRWARDKGIQVPKYGRVPSEVSRQFEDEFLSGELPDDQSDQQQITQQDRDTARLYYKTLSDTAFENLVLATKNGGQFPPDPSPGTEASLRSLRRKGLAEGREITGVGLAALELRDKYKPSAPPAI